MVFAKEFFKKINIEKNQQTTFLSLNKLPNFYEFTIEGVQA